MILAEGAEARHIDETAMAEWHLSSSVLVEAAGRECTQVLINVWPHIAPHVSGSPSLILAAGSGNNALTRDPEFTIGFVQRHWKKLLFGSDYMGHNQHIPQVQWLANMDITPEMRYAIAKGNARKVLGLD